MSLLAQHPQLQTILDETRRRKRTAYLVGGFLRDHQLNRPITDFDFAVDKDAITLARALSRRIKGAFVLLDQVHGSARVVKKTQGVAWTFDFTDFRGATIQQDLNLRDFTINSFCVDLSHADDLSAHMLEVKGARGDLKAKKVRMVNAQVFKDDPLRLMRAFSLKASLGFSIEAKTLARIRQDNELITTVSMERVRDELFKVLASRHCAGTLQAMDKIGLLVRVIPHVAVMKGVHQGGYHHLDVWRHSLEVVHQLEGILTKEMANEGMKSYFQETIGGGHTRVALLKMAALLHDIGKPETRKPEGTRITFHGHEHAGARITRFVAKHLKLSVNERYFLEDMVRMHLRPGYLSNFDAPSPRAVFRYMRDTKDEAIGLALLAMADQAATRGPLTTQAKQEHHAKICRMLIDHYFALKQKQSTDPTKRLLTGNDLIKTLKLKPSPLFAKILGAVEESHALGKITTKKDALGLASVIARDEVTK